MANFIEVTKNNAYLFQNIIFSQKIKVVLTCLFLYLVAPFSFANEDVALIFTSKGVAFEQVIAGISDDLEEDLQFEIYTLNKKSNISEIEDQIKEHQPKIIILIENGPLKLYTKFQKAHPNNDFPPSVAVAALFVDRYLGKIKNATGIRYEIPAVTSAVNLRSVLNRKVKRVGVVHRSWMTSMIVNNAKYCAEEGIELVSIVIPNKDKSLDKKLKQGLQKLLDNKVDAIWVLNDNTLLNRKMIGSSWLPALGKSKIPVIVNIKPLLSTKLNLGMFATIPDNYALGVQAASLIGEIMDDDWEIGDREIEQPLSVKKILNLTVLNKKGLNYHLDKLNTMDEVMK